MGNKILAGGRIGIVTALALSLAVVGFASNQSPKVRRLSPSTKISSITVTPVSEMNFDQSLGGGRLIKDLYVNDQGTVYAVLEDRAVSRGTGYSIKVMREARSLTKEFRCLGQIWNPPLIVNQVTADGSGNIYAAVEWPIKRGGIIVINPEGVLVSKLTLPDFVPLAIAVDREGRIWLAGWKVNPSGPSGIGPTIDPNPEQVRIYGHDLKLLGIPVRDLVREHYVSSFGVTDDSVVYYAAGTNELYLFENGELREKLLMGEVRQLELPAEAKGKNVTVRRGVTSVVRLNENLIVLGGFYNYVVDDVSRLAGKNFIVLVDLAAATVSSEFEAPKGSLIRTNTKGEVVYLSRSAEGQPSLRRMRIRF